MDARILITNDDGAHSEGIDLLAALAGRHCDDVWVVAPDSERSGASHSVSLADPLRVRQLGPKKFSVRGSPTDCVVLGVKHLCKDRRPTVILSGVNRGANIADDVLYSGTVAAAREGAQFGIPSIAFSQIFARGQAVPWHTAERHGADLLPRLLELCRAGDMLLNVNFPPLEPNAVRGLAVTRQGKRTHQEIAVQERIDNRGFPYYWLNFEHQVVNPEPGTDLAAIAEGLISITPLQLDMTDHPAVGRIADALA
ncbi:MAG: 5'/3'-nucleotidase SurE [Rhodocyclaceae bacterium]|jgi:5'-nucleotidase|nr:5'/3'-nucleotidase SurE [Rhodocyclaceae bacterium]